jgi:TatD DNase family protein
MWIDAHNHLHDPRLPRLDVEFVASLRALGIERAVVNGTREDDWPEVARLAREFPGFVIPSFGLHPWFVAERSEHWLVKLRACLDSHPGCPVGEIGLDRWIQGNDPRTQGEVFRAQMELAAELDRPVAIHCLKAWDDLARLWPELPARPERCLLHGFTGDPGLALRWVKNGCLLGFGGYTLTPRKSAAREAFQRIPLDHILLETDAPDMAAPEEFLTHHLPDPRSHHPGNLACYGEILAGWRGLPPVELATALQSNFARWMGQYPAGQSI